MRLNEQTRILALPVYSPSAYELRVEAMDDIDLLAELKAASMIYAMNRTSENYEDMQACSRVVFRRLASRTAA